MINKLLIAAFSLILSSCSLLPAKKNDAINYVFNSIPSVQVSQRHATTLYVSAIESDPVYDTDNMAYSLHPYVIEYFAKNKWADTPARLLRPLVLKTLEDTRHFHAVTSSASPVRFDYVLNLKVVELQQVFSRDSSCERFSLHAEIISARTGKIIATREFTVEKPAFYRSPYGGVAAANKAVCDALEQLASFCVSTI